MDWVKIFAPGAIEQLNANYRQQLPLKGTRREKDFHPVCKLFLPWTSGTWLLTEMDDDGLAFGLADLGMGTPELGYLSIDEIWEATGPGGLKVERDMFFRADHPLSWYAEQARQHGCITV